MLGIMMQWAGVGASEVLTKLEELGFFRYVLPFLLIFAVIYAVLTKIHVFQNNKGAAVVVAVAVGLLTLQFDIVPAFFQNIFPKFGIGLAVLIIALILAGAFIESEKAPYKWIFFGLGAAIFIVILVLTFSDWQFLGNWWWQQYGALVIGAIVIVVAMIMVILASTGKLGGKEK